MKPIIALAALASAAALLAFATPAEARTYPWCAYMGSTLSGDLGTNCGFVSYEQCMATVTGIGGYCAPNPMYPRVPPPNPRARKRVYH